MAVLFIATSFTGAYFSDTVSVTNNTFETGSWGGGSPPPVAEEENVIISEFMANPEAVADASGEWFEIYNPISTAINLNGWKYCDDDCSETKIINTDLIINPHSYIVFAKNSNTSTNGGVNVDYVISNLSLANSDDSILIYKPDGLGGSNLIDRVDYLASASWPIISGESAMLNDLTKDNSVILNWSVSASTFGSGDKGSPGGPNS